MDDEDSKSFGEELEFPTADGIPLRPKLISIQTSTSALNEKTKCQGDHDRYSNQQGRWPFLAMLLSSSILLGYIYFMCYLRSEAISKFREALQDLKNNIISGQCEGLMQYSTPRLEHSLTTSPNQSKLYWHGSNPDEHKMNSSNKEAFEIDPPQDVYYKRGIILLVVLMSLLTITSMIITASLQRAKTEKRCEILAYLLNIAMLSLHLMFVVFLLLLTYQSINNKLGALGITASCYCTGNSQNSVEPLLSPLLNDAYQCTCMTPQTGTPISLLVSNPYAITDRSLNTFNSNYEGEICTIYRANQEDVHKAARLHVTEVKMLYGVIQVSILPLVISFFAWAVFIKTKQSQEPLPAEFIQDHILSITLYIFSEAIDIFSLLDDLDEHGRYLTSMHPLVNGILGTFGAGLCVLYVLFPAEKVFSISVGKTSKTENNILLYLIKLDWPLKLCTICVNISLLVVRALLFRQFEGFSGMTVRSFFVLFMIREIYTILPKSAEVIFEMCTAIKQTEKSNEATLV